MLKTGMEQENLRQFLIMVKFIMENGLTAKKMALVLYIQETQKEFIQEYGKMMF